MRRRAFLAGAAGVAIGGLAGCLGPSDAGRRPLESNPVGRGLEERPRLGSPDAGVTLVSFEKPNCSGCADFHAETVPRIREEWIEGGRATLYGRTAPVSGWSEPAVNGLKEAYRRHPPAYWALKGLYFEEQDAMDEETVHVRTREFLADRAVEAEAVVTAMTERAHADAIAADAEAANAAAEGPLFTTPMTWLFVDGDFVTTFGNADFEEFRTAVESHG